MTVEHHLVYHSHYAVMWGVPGNIMKIIVRVQSSTDPRCKVGALGRVTLLASYNGARSDSVQFTFPELTPVSPPWAVGGEVLPALNGTDRARLNRTTRASNISHHHHPSTSSAPYSKGSHRVDS